MHRGSKSEKLVELICAWSAYLHDGQRQTQRRIWRPDTWPHPITCRKRSKALAWNGASTHGASDQPGAVHSAYGAFPTSAGVESTFRSWLDSGHDDEPVGRGLL